MLGYTSFSWILSQGLTVKFGNCFESTVNNVKQDLNDTTQNINILTWGFMVF